MSIQTTRLKTQKIFEIPIVTEKKEKVLEELRKYLKKSTKTSRKTGKICADPCVILTPNPEQIVYAIHHPWFSELLKNADIAIPDGIGIIWASRILHKKAPEERITGIEFFENLVSLAEEEGFRIGLIGGRSGVADKARECLSRKHPDLEIIAAELGEYRIDERQGRLLFGEQEKDDTMTIRRLAKRISMGGTRIVFVALGAPKQELFIRMLSDALARLPRLRPTVLMAVGGTLDELALVVRPAPGWVSRAGLKWLWRLVHEPWRWRRQTALLRFVGLVIRERFSN